MLSLFRTLGAIEGPALLAVLHALRVEHAANDVVANARKVLHAAAADQNNRVLLKIVTLARDVGERFEAVGQTNLGHLAKGRVRLLRCRRIDARADGALLRAFLQRRHLVALRLGAARFANELIDCRHSSSSSAPLARQNKNGA